ncbi:collagen alpha-2(I) chain-like [Balaenoptera acutorostrata]|uniref:Collagen alpha-2(I) chain-like n=1 Tax=Balaenoptera acutorostrata TaxID=9767 RepID=A0ABM3S4L0_BALAC|nr:collagen alpha-2(I) chain-like [Balaenoptera acutorostrata]
MGRLSASCSQEEVTSRASREEPEARRAAPRARAPGSPPPLGRAFYNSRWRRQNGQGLLFPSSPHPTLKQSSDSFPPRTARLEAAAAGSGRGHPSHLHPSPRTALRGGDRNPRASTSLSVNGAPGIRRPLLPAREAVTLSFKRQFPGSRSDNQGAPGPGAAKTRRGPARESQARHPLAGTGPVTTRRRAEVRPAQPRWVPTRQEDQGRGARATKAAGTRGHGGQSLDRRARPGPGRSRRLSAPPPALASSPGRVGSSTLLFGSKGDTLRAPGAGCGHKSRRGALLPAARTGTPGRRPRVPTAPDAPLSRSGPGGPETAQGIKPEASPFTRERERPCPLDATIFHPRGHRTLRWPGPHRIAA